MTATVLVVGATGEMGQRIVRLLQRWTPAARVIGANRSGRGHPGFPVRRVDMHDERTLEGALGDVSLLVNAVGPYVYDPGPLLRACVAARVDYLDLAEDLAWLVRVSEAAARSGAGASGVTLIPGCSTVPGLVALLASRWAERTDVASVSAFLSMGSANPPSRGLVAGLLAPLGRPAADGSRWFTKLVRAEITDARRLAFGCWPAPFPRAGMRVGARQLPLRFHAGFDRAWVNAALRLAAPIAGRLPPRWIPTLAGVALPFVRAASVLGTPRGVLLVRAEDNAGSELDRIEVHAEANGLDVPAAPVVWVVARLLAKGLDGGGLCGLEDVVALDEALAWLREAGYAVREGGGPRRS